MRIYIKKTHQWKQTTRAGTRTGPARAWTRTAKKPYLWKRSLMCVGIFRAITGSLFACLIFGIDLHVLMFCKAFIICALCLHDNCVLF